MDVPLKCCTTCGKTQPVSSFYNKAQAKDGKDSRCKECCREGGRRSYKARKPVWIARPKLAVVQKTCTRCGQTKDAHDFYNSRTSPDGKLAACRTCSRARALKWYHDNSNRIAEQRRRKQKEHPERAALYARTYRRNHPDKAEAAKVRARQWRKNNWGKIKHASIVNKHRRRARANELASTFKSSDWRKSKEYWKNCCAYCGRAPGPGQSLAQEHFIPLNKGGPYTATNIIPACHDIDGCNNSKADQDAEQWLTKKFGSEYAADVLRDIRLYFDWIRHGD